jgi:hypothetical protein
MTRSMLVLVVFVSGLAHIDNVTAQIATYADVRAQGGLRVDGAELKHLMPDAKVISRTQAGSTRSWRNKPDGTLMASTDGRGSSGGSNSYASARGTWRVNDAGQLCVTIPWPRNPDDWCKTIFRVGTKYYGVGRLDDNAQASEFEFSK